MIRIFFSLIALLIANLAYAATYTLPDDAGSAPFNNCSYSAPTLTCTTAPSLSSNTTINLTTNLIWQNNTALIFNSRTQVNPNGAFSLTIKSSGSLIVNSNNNIWANIEAAGSMEINSNSTIYGNAAAGGSLIVRSSTEVYGTCTQYSGTPVGDCVGSSQVGYFAFNEDTAWSINSPSIENLVDSTLTAFPTGSVAQVAGYTCKGAAISNNSSEAAKDYIDTGIDLDSDIGNSGTIMFWVKFNENWGDSDRVLLDASQGTNEFKLSMQTNNNIRFRGKIGGSSTTISTSIPGSKPKAGDWAHIAFGWDRTTNTLTFKINNNFKSSSSFYLNLANLETLVLGDNRASIAPFASANATFDEVRIYNKLLTNNEMTALATVTQPDCTTTITLPDPVIEYRFDELAWNGDADEVTDSSGNDNDAVADFASNTDTTSDGKLCRAANFQGSGQHLDTPTLTTLEGTSSLSFWIKTTQTGDSINWSSPGITGVEESRGANDIFWGWINETGNIGLTLQDSKTQHSNTAINDNIYHHVVLTFNIDNREVNIYIDGVLDETYTTGSASIDFSFDQIGYFRRTNDSTPNYLDAILDEFIVFDEVLSADQANLIYTLQDTGKNLDGSLRSCITEPAPLAWFSLDEISAGQYPDDLNNAFSLDTTGVATPVDASQGKICAANEIDDNNTAVNIDALNSNINAGSALGETGAVSFWFNSDTDWDGLGRSRILFDASTSDDVFGLQLNADGELVFYIQDTTNASNTLKYTSDATGFSAGDWHHLSVSWDFPNESVVFYIDGFEFNSSLTGAAWSSFTGIPSLNNLIFGDARDDNSLGGVVQSAAGRLDEIYVFDTKLTAGEAIYIYQESHACPIQPISYHRFEESTWTGASNEIKDTTANGLDLTNNSNRANLTAGRVCTGAFFNGTQGLISRNHDATYDDYSAGIGATLWINPTEIPSTGDHTLINKVDLFALRLSPGGELRLNYYDSSNTSQIMLTSGLNIGTNSWYHVAMSISPNRQRIWLDGILVLDNSINNGIRTGTQKPFRVGANDNSISNSTYAGRIDELRLYNQSISETEVNRDLLAIHSCDSDLVGWYQLEETNLTGAADEVEDESGNRNNGFSEGATAQATGYLCYGATIPQNNSQAAKEGIETGVDLDFDLGNKGTIMLWYNSSEDWDTGRRRVLVDASTDTSDPGSANNKFFFLSIEAGGNLFFGFEDDPDDDDFSITEPIGTIRNAGDWHHVAITWDFTQSTAYNATNTPFKILVDGVIVADDVVRDSYNATNSADPDTINGMPNFQRIHIGDNSSNYNFVPDASANGIVDEIRFYSRILTEAEVINASTEPHPCAGEAIVRYQFEETSWNGTYDEVQDDSGYNYDALASGNVSPTLYTSTCRAAFFTADDASPNSINAIVTPMDVDRDIGNEGTIAMWIKPAENWGSASVERNLFDASRNPRELYASLLTNGALRFVMTDNAGNKINYDSNTQSFTSQEWVHVAFSWSFSAQRLVTYINGVEDSRQTLAGVFDIADLSSLYLGDSQNSRATGVNNSWSGWMEDARIYNYERSAAEILANFNGYKPCVELLNHFDIDDAAPFNQAINCQTESITITAKLADNSTATSFTGSINLTTSTNNGDWSFTGNASHNFTAGAADSGQASIEFTAADNGVLTGLSLRHTQPGLVNIDAVYPTSSKSERSGSAIAAEDDPNINFAQSGLQISQQSAPDTGISNLAIIAAANSPALLLRAITTDPTTGVCNNLFANGADVEFTLGSSCTNPTTCAVGEKVLFSNNGNSNSLANPQNQESSSSTEPVDIRFATNSTASFSLNTPDIGTQPVSFSHQLRDDDGNPTELLSTTLTLQSRPASLSIVTIDGSATGSFITTDAFKKAGESFTTAIEALDANGAAVASFGRVTGLYDVSFVNSSIAAPSGGTFAGISGDSTASQWLGTDADSDGNAERLQLNSAATGYTGLSYGEVGSVNLQATINNFLGYGINISSPNTLVGRFTPAYYKLTAVNAGTANWGSGSYQYQGQADDLTGVIFDIQAFDINDAALTNYTAAAVNFASNTGALNKPADNNASGNAFSTTGSSLTSNAFSWTVDDDINNDGNVFNDTVRLSADITNVNWQRKTTAPNVNDTLQNITNLQLAASAFTDEDGICVQTSNAASTCLDASLDIADRALYYGRLTLPDQVDGGEQLAYLPSTIEYLSSIDASGEPLFSQQVTENSAPISGLDYLAGSTCSLTACPATGALSNISFSGPSGTGTNFVSGEGLFEYDLGSSDAGILEVHANMPTWLNWDWEADGSFTPPSSFILFGEYQGRSPILFIRPGAR